MTALARFLFGPLLLAVLIVLCAVLYTRLP